MKQICLRCGYKWDSNKEKPKACPNCKSYKWQTKKKEDTDNV